MTDQTAQKIAAALERIGSALWLLAVAGVVIAGQVLAYNINRF